MLFRSGRLTHVTADDAQEYPGVIMGTTRINSTPAITLFDSGASHSFMSQNFAQLHGVAFEGLLTPLMVKSPGSSWCTTMVSRDLLVDIGYRLFPTSLVALKSTDIDVILADTTPAAAYSLAKETTRKFTGSQTS